MDIKTTLEKYKALGDYLAPDYEQNNEVLSEFKANNPNLSNNQTSELINLLQNNSKITHKYFVADLLYLYDNFDKELVESLLETAINHRDPSYSRIFLRPCLAVYGTKTIADKLADKFVKADIIERIGISKLVYWLTPQENGEADKLHMTILERANKTTNLVELYYYKLRYSDKIKDSKNIPNNAEELIKAIEGHKKNEDLLYNKLGWARTKHENNSFSLSNLEWWQKLFGT